MQDVFDKPGPERLVAGGTWFLLLMMLGGVFAFLWGIVLSRTYGPVGFGIFNTAWSMYNFAWVFVFGGLYQGLMKFGSEYVAKKSIKTKSYFSSVLKYMTILGVVAFILLIYISLHIEDPIMSIIILTVGVSFLFTGTKDGMSSIIGSFQKSDYLSIINSSRNVVIFVFGVIFILLRAPSYMLPSLLIIGTIWQLGLCIYFFRKSIMDLPPFKKNPTNLFDEGGKPGFQAIQKFHNVVKFGFFISLGMISFNVMKSLDIMVLNLFFDYASVGVYSIADAASSILFYMTSFSVPLIPAIAEAYSKKNSKLLGEYVKIAVKYPLLIGVPITVLVFTMAEPLVMNLYGPDFAEAIVPLQILIIGTFLLMFGYNLSSIFIGIGKSKLSGIIMSIAAVQYILSLYFLTPIFGFIGAAFSLTLTGFTSILLVPYYLKKELGISIYEGVHLVLLAAIIMAIVLLAVPKDNAFLILLAIIGSVVIFVVSLYLMEYITKDDVKMLRIAGSTFRPPSSKIKTTVISSELSTNKKRNKYRIKISKRKK